VLNLDFIYFIFLQVNAIKVGCNVNKGMSINNI